jgi:cation diffusion facilitator CzcD-associated flavoprotein CzcO
MIQDHVAAETVGHDGIGQGMEGSTLSNGAAGPDETKMSIADIRKKYDEERDKRLRSDGIKQYLFLDRSDDPHLRAFSEDPCTNDRSDTITIQDGQFVKHLILGCGLGGLMAGINLVKAGISPKDLCFMDNVGGWGGAWWLNRYPGVSCDIESYTYLPLLHETGYMPKHNFSYGHEIQGYIERLAKEYGLYEQAMFRTQINSAKWDDMAKEWVVALQKQTGKPATTHDYTIRARFFSHFSGAHLHPKIPNLPGFLKFQGEQFHISRWRYDVTGGSWEDPVLDKLAGKRVGIVGTGASGVQPVSYVAKYAKSLQVFQRTPANVDHREQAPTDPETWPKIAFDSKWWETRNINVSNAFSNTLPPGEERLVTDRTQTPKTYRIIFGGKDPLSEKLKLPEQLDEYVSQLVEEDLSRMTGIRERVKSEVRDPENVKRLTPWHTTWCKRPCFSDDYLKTFNRDNVSLVDHVGGVEAVTEKGLVVDGKEHELDVIVWATGYRAPSSEFWGKRSHMVITGKGGRDLDGKWNEAIASLHGRMTADFPNFFLGGGGMWQSGMTLNYVWVLEGLTKHNAYIALEAERRAKAEKGADIQGFSVEPTHEAEESWSMEVMKRSVRMAALGGCTPNYNNEEGYVTLS